MSQLKGYPSKKRDTRLIDSEVHTTAEPIRYEQHGLSVLAHVYTTLVGTDAVEAPSTTEMMTVTAHIIQVGDIINFTSGALSAHEFKVQKIDTNTVTFSENLPIAPSAADTFEILRHKYPKISSDGSLITSSVSAGPVQYTRNGVNTTVTEDTGTPSNNRPLPVKLTGVTGDVNITAGDLNVDIQHGSSSVLIYGNDGAVNRAIKTNASGNIDVIATDLDIRNLDSSSDSVDVSGSSVTVTATDLDIRPIVFATDSIDVTGSSVDVSGTVSVTATNLDIRDLVFATDKVDASGSSVTVSATNLDVRDLVFAQDKVDVSGSAVTVSATNLDIRDLLFASDKVDVSGSTVNATVVNPAVSTFVRNDYTSVAVTTGAYVTLVASTAAIYKRMSIFDSSGQTLKIAIGAAASEVDILAVFPGGNGDIDINIAAGTRISIKAVSASASVGEIVINFFI